MVTETFRRGFVLKCGFAPQNAISCRKFCLPGEVVQNEPGGATGCQNGHQS